VTIAAKKLKFYVSSIKIVRYIYNANGRHSNYIKIIKIVEWEPCTNIIDTRAFISVYVYYRI